MLDYPFRLCYITSKHESVFLMEEKIMPKKAKNKVKKPKKETYFSKVRKELKLVVWPSLKETAKYSISTIVFCVFICLFFIILNLLMSLLKGMF